MIYLLLGVLVIFIIFGLAVANFSDAQLTDYFKQMENKNLHMDVSQFFNVVNKNEFSNLLKLNFIKDSRLGCYNPGKANVELSETMKGSWKLSTITVCAHELGHALQYRDNPKVLLKNFKFAKLVKFLGFLFLPNFILSIVLLFCDLWIVSVILISICFASFVIALALKITTIKIEKQASANAMSLLEKYQICTDEELELCKKLLNYAKLTYIAELFRALLCWTMLTRKPKIF